MPQRQRPTTPDPRILQDYLVGGHDGFTGFIEANPEAAGTFFLNKILADMRHDFRNPDRVDAGVLAALKAFFRRPGGLGTTYAKKLYWDKDLQSEQRFLQGYFWNMQFSESISSTRLERVYLQFLFRNMLTNYPKEMERSFTIVGYTIYKNPAPDAASGAAGDEDDDGGAMPEEILAQLQSGDGSLTQIDWSPKGGVGRVAVLKDIALDPGKRVPVFVDVSTGKPELTDKIFGDSGGGWMQKTLKYDSVYPRSCVTCHEGRKHSTSRTGVVGGCGGE